MGGAHINLQMANLKGSYFKYFIINIYFFDELSDILLSRLFHCSEFI